MSGDDDGEDCDGPPSIAATYDRIASHFARTRANPWPEVESFLEGRTGATTLDLGCGNGRHAELLSSRGERVIGIDVSDGLLREATDRAHERDYANAFSPVNGDASVLPLRNDTIELGVYVAALHHLDSRGRRIRSLSELSRVLTPDGTALVSAWSTASDRFEQEGTGAPNEGFDTEVDWTLPGGETVARFYHIYHPDEFRADLDVSALSTVEAFVSSGNCYAVVAPE